MRIFDGNATKVASYAAVGFAPHSSKHSVNSLFTYLAVQVLSIALNIKNPPQICQEAHPANQKHVRILMAMRQKSLPYTAVGFAPHSSKPLRVLFAFISILYASMNSHEYKNPTENTVGF